MQTINALTITRSVNKWLEGTRQPRILHIFDNACNLVNEHKEVLSIVTAQIGNGPFNLVVEDDIDFTDRLNIQSEITIVDDRLQVGDLIVNMVDAKIWDPHPDWGRLHGAKANGLASLIDLEVISLQEIASSQTALLAATLNADIPSAIAFTSQLAGLGAGLTPAGDDFIMGALYAIWIIHPSEVASKVGTKIAETAAPLTTSLSAAWIGSAGRGEAGQVWHEFFDALIAGDNSSIQLRIEKILAVGETSGEDALAGFLSTMQAYMALLLRKEATLSRE